MSLELTLENEGGAHVIGLAGRLDNLTAPAFDQKILSLTGEPGPRVVLDLTRLDYISSAGLRSVLGALKKVSAKSGRLVIAAPTPSVVEVFEISGFKALIPIHEDRAAAVAASA